MDDKVSEPARREGLAADSADPAWGAVSSRVRRRAAHDKADRALLPITLIHAFSAYSLAMAALSSAGGADLPRWFVTLMAGAALWAGVSAGASWFMKQVPLALPAMAAVVVIATILLAGGWFSLVLWANVVALVLLYFAHRARLALVDLPR
jgi:hypothetical protein